MMGWLLDELVLLGLEVNKSKTKLLTTEAGYFKEGLTSILQINGAYFHVLGCHEWHRYLGKHLCFAAHLRSNIEIQHRLAAAWGQYHKYKYILSNRNLSIKKRLRFFGSSARYGLAQ